MPGSSQFNLFHRADFKDILWSQFHNEVIKGRKRRSAGILGTLLLSTMCKYLISSKSLPTFRSYSPPELAVNKLRAGQLNSSFLASHALITEIRYLLN